MLLKYFLKLPLISNVAGGVNLRIYCTDGTSGGAQLQAKTLFVKHESKTVSLKSMSVGFRSDDYVNRLPTLQRLLRMCAAFYLPCFVRELGALAGQNPTYREHPWKA